MKKQLINEVRQLQKTAGLLKEDIGNIPQTLTFTFETKFILYKIYKAFNGNMIPWNQIDINKLQAEIQDDLQFQIDSDSYFKQLIANGGLGDYYEKNDEVSEIHPDKDWDEEEDEEEPYENDMDNLDTSLPKV